ncbi:hypothetical protein [Streptoalloteichus hindustanus]|uniref:Uncharacterized protein n=1 Tax=Streptoalloteichus hindustanus TaxID=2017 RepID=A0A1M5PWK4_STRHI|nr:hypothetical protein [Streptoalloteichus hindustanus]SHH05911.1 hypothetical protein SAMN05444320_12019 [Streptoalloteichus hindustanus]
MVQAKDVPTGDDYQNWTWKQIKAAICGGSEEHGGDAARKAHSDPASFWDAGNKIQNLGRVFALCRDTLRVHAKAIAGPGGVWKGPSAEAFLNQMDYYAKVFDAHVDRVTKPEFGGSRSLPQELVDAGNKLSTAQAKINAIDLWYADQATRLGASTFEKDGAKLVTVSSKPEVVKLLDRDMRKVIGELAGEYEVKVPTFSAPVPKTPNVNPNNPGGPNPYGVNTGPPPQFVPPPGSGGPGQQFPGFTGVPGGSLTNFPGGDGSGGGFPGGGYPGGGLPGGGVPGQFPGGQFPGAGVPGGGVPGEFPGGTSAGTHVPGADLSGGVPGQVPAQYAPLSPKELGLAPDPYDPGTGLAGTGAFTHTQAPYAPGARLDPYHPGGSPGATGYPGGGVPAPYPGSGPGSGGPTPFPGAGQVRYPVVKPGSRPTPYPGGGPDGGLARYPVLRKGGGVTPYPGDKPGSSDLAGFSGGEPGRLKPYPGGGPGSTDLPGFSGGKSQGGPSPFPGGGGGIPGGGGVPPYSPGSGSLRGGGVKSYGDGAGGPASGGRPAGGGGRTGGTGGPGGTGPGSGRGGTTGAPGMPTSPGMPGAPGKQEQERERATWLVEDEDVWGANPDAPPGVIGRSG